MIRGSGVDAAARSAAVAAQGDAATAQADINALQPDLTLPQKLGGAASAGSAATAAAIDHQHGGAIDGIADGSYPAAGEIGELLITSTLPAGAVALTSGVAADVAAITLTPGRWLIEGNIRIERKTGGPEAVSPTACSLSTTSATQEALQLRAAQFSNYALGNNNTIGFVAPARYLVVAVDTPIYLVVTATWVTGDVSAYGTLRAIRQG